MRLFSKKLLAILLVLVMIISVPTQAFAATSNTYIKDVKMVVASSASEAAARIGKDYKLLSTPIYEGKTNTFIAYQTTDNPLEAITDIRAMNMNGGWSYEKYNEYMDQQSRNINGIIADLEIAIKEFRENYKANKPSAIYAYKVLERYFEDDTQITLAKFIMEKALEERDRLFTLVLDCNIEVLGTLERSLLIGCQETLPENFAERMALVNAYEYAENSSYSAGAKSIISGLSKLQEAVYVYENSGYVFGVQDESVINDWLNSLEDTSLIEPWAQGHYLYEILKRTSYQGIDNEQTLYDLFMNHKTSINANGEIEADFPANVFYAASGVLTAGQLAMLKLVGIKDLLLMQPLNLDDYVQAIEVVDVMSASCALEEMSVYSGVDRTVFNTGDVAMTSETMQAIANDQEGAWAKKSERSNIKTGLIIGTAVSGGVGVLSGIATYIAVTKYATANLTFNPAWFEGGVELVKGAAAAGQTYSTAFWENLGIALQNSFASAAAFSITVIAIAVLLIVSCILIILAAIEASEPGEWLVIPRKIMNDIINSEGEHEYIYYDCVREAHVDANGIEQGDGKLMDVGYWEDESHYRQWVAVYTTKDSKAGKPIYAKGFTVTMGEPNVNVGFLQLRKFNEVKAYNLNTYCSAKKVYLNYKVNTRYTPQTAASVFNQNAVFAFGGCGLLIGLAGGLVIGVKSKGRKQTNS